MNELKMKVAGGNLVVNLDTETLQASILFETENYDIVDLACVEMQDAKNDSYYHKHHNNRDEVNNYTNIRIQTYGNPYTEDYTYEERTSVSDILKACNDPNIKMPDSIKL